MSAHDLHNKCSLMGISCTDNCVNGFDNTMKGRICSNGHVCSTEIVIDWTDLKFQDILNQGSFLTVFIWILKFTMPAMWRDLNLFLSSCVILFSVNNSSNKLFHSTLNKFAPVKEPSPPITTWQNYYCKLVRSKKRNRVFACSINIWILYFLLKIY